MSCKFPVCWGKHLKDNDACGCDPPPRPKIREARRALGLSYQKLADTLGVADRQTIRRYEDGSRHAPPLFLHALSMLCALRGLDPAAFNLPEVSRIP